MKQEFIGYTSRKDILIFSPGVGWEIGKLNKDAGIKILRLRRVYDKKPIIDSRWQSKKKIKTYFPIKITVEIGE